MASVFLDASDLNDYISPSQACINPLFTSNSNNAATNDKQEETTEKVISSAKATSSAANNEMRGSTTRRQRKRIQLNSSYKKEDDSKKEAAKVSVADCLACSGCVTSAETVLITSHSISTLRENIGGKRVVFTISPVCISELSRYLEIENSRSVYERVASFLHTECNAEWVVDGGVFGDIALLESSQEFVDRYETVHASMEETKELKVQPTSIAISATQSRYFSSTDEEDAITLTHPPGRDDDYYRTQTHLLPMVASSCPGFVCYVEKTSPKAIPFLSTTKSPMAIGGALLKHVLFPGASIYHVAVMPCYDKKLEAVRKDFAWDEKDGTTLYDVDLVITTSELLTLLTDSVTNACAAAAIASHSSFTIPSNDQIRSFLLQLPSPSVASPCSMLYNHSISLSSASPKFIHSYSDPLPILDSNDNSLSSLSLTPPQPYPFASGGYADFIFRHASFLLFQYHIPHTTPLPWKPALLSTATTTSTNNKIARRRRNQKPNFDFCEVALYYSESNGSYTLTPSPEHSYRPVLQFAIAYGFKNIQLFLSKLSPSSKTPYHYIEIMACPGGCVNGGGQRSASSSSDNQETPTDKRQRLYQNHILLDRIRTRHTGAGAGSNPDNTTTLEYNNPFLNELYNTKLASSMMNEMEDRMHVDDDQATVVKPFGMPSRRLLHTRYHAVPKLELSMGATAGVALEDTQW